MIRPARQSDADALWRILEPVIRAGETYPLPRDLSRQDALAYWLSPAHEVFVATDDGPAAGTAEAEAGAGGDAEASEGAAGDAESPDERIIGTFYLKANQSGGGAHVANCGYMVARGATGRGVARQMCTFSLERAKARGFHAMQFNFVIATNDRAVKLWQAMGFATVGRLPGAFAHPTHGYVDALVMWRDL